MLSNCLIYIKACLKKKELACWSASIWLWFYCRLSNFFRIFYGFPFLANHLILVFYWTLVLIVDVHINKLRTLTIFSTKIVRKFGIYYYVPPWTNTLINCFKLLHFIYVSIFNIDFFKRNPVWCMYIGSTKAKINTQLIYYLILFQHTLTSVNLFFATSRSRAIFTNIGWWNIILHT